VGLLRRAGPSNVQAIPRRHRLLVRLLQRLQHRNLRSRAGMLRRHRQRPSECHRRNGRRRRRSSARSGDCFAPGSRTKRPCSFTPNRADINHSWPKPANSKPSWRKNTGRCGYSVPPWQERLPRAANERVSWAYRPATASTPISTSTAQTRLRERARNSLPPQCCCGLCPPPRHPRRGTCTARRRRSSSKQPPSRPRARRPASANRGTREAMGPRRGPSPQCTRVGPRNTPPTRGARRPESGSSTLAGRRATVMPATSSTLDGRAKRRRRRPQATTPDGAGATTAMKTSRRRRNPRGPACSVGRSARRLSRSASASQRPSSSTTGRWTPACGSTTTAWCASWAEPPVMRSSSATSPYTSLTRPGRGSSICGQSDP
jgi:hypothetical protein